MLSVQNSNRARGQLANGSVTADIITNGQLSHAADYKPLVIGYSNGAAVRLADVAEVTDSVQNVRAAGYLNGQRAVMLIISREPGANIIDTVDRIRAGAAVHQRHHSPGHRLDDRARSHDHDSRVRGGRRADARVLGRARDPGGVSSS